MPQSITGQIDPQVNSASLMPTFLGIDCGGSTTRARLVGEDNSVLHRGQSGPGNLASTPQVEIERHIREAVGDGLNPDYVVGCFAGLLTEADRQRAIVLLEQVVPGAKIQAYADYWASLAADPETDVIVIAGTGALIASRIPGGCVKSAGGGPLLGDFGSAFDIGRRALGKTVLAAQPAEASPLFWQTVAEIFGSDEPNQILAAVYRSVSPAARVARLAPVVAMDAQRGLDYARQTIDQAISSLADATWQHIRAHMPEKTRQEVIRIRLSGGLWEIDGGILAQDFTKQMDACGSRNTRQSITVEKLSAEPVEGAVALARQMAENYSTT